MRQIRKRKLHQENDAQIHKIIDRLFASNRSRSSGSILLAIKDEIKFIDRIGSKGLLKLLECLYLLENTHNSYELELLTEICSFLDTKCSSGELLSVMIGLLVECKNLNQIRVFLDITLNISKKYVKDDVQFRLKNKTIQSFISFMDFIDDEILMKKIFELLDVLMSLNIENWNRVTQDIIDISIGSFHQSTDSDLKRIIQGIIKKTRKFWTAHMTFLHEILIEMKRELRSNSNESGRIFPFGTLEILSEFVLELSSIASKAYRFDVLEDLKSTFVQTVGFLSKTDLHSTIPVFVFRFCRKICKAFASDIEFILSFSEFYKLFIIEWWSIEEHKNNPVVASEIFKINLMMSQALKDYALLQSLILSSLFQKSVVVFDSYKVVNPLYQIIKFITSIENESPETAKIFIETLNSIYTKYLDSDPTDWGDMVPAISLGLQMFYKEKVDNFLLGGMAILKIIVHTTALSDDIWQLNGSHHRVLISLITSIFENITANDDSFEEVLKNLSEILSNIIRKIVFSFPVRILALRLFASVTVRKSGKFEKNGVSKVQKDFDNLCNQIIPQISHLNTELLEILLDSLLLLISSPNSPNLTFSHYISSLVRILPNNSSEISEKIIKILQSLPLLSFLQQNSTLCYETEDKFDLRFCEFEHDRSGSALNLVRFVNSCLSKEPPSRETLINIYRKHVINRFDSGSYLHEAISKNMVTDEFDLIIEIFISHAPKLYLEQFPYSPQSVLTVISECILNSMKPGEICEKSSLILLIMLYVLENVNKNFSNGLYEISNSSMKIINLREIEDWFTLHRFELLQISCFHKFDNYVYYHLQHWIENKDSIKKIQEAPTLFTQIIECLLRIKAEDMIGVFAECAHNHFCKFFLESVLSECRFRSEKPVQVLENEISSLINRNISPQPKSEEPAKFKILKKDVDSCYSEIDSEYVNLCAAKIKDFYERSVQPEEFNEWHRKISESSSAAIKFDKSVLSSNLLNSWQELENFRENSMTNLNESSSIDEKNDFSSLKCTQHTLYVNFIQYSQKPWLNFEMSKPFQQHLSLHLHSGDFEKFYNSILIWKFLCETNSFLFEEPENQRIFNFVNDSAIDCMFGDSVEVVQTYKRCISMILQDDSMKTRVSSRLDSSQMTGIYSFLSKTNHGTMHNIFNGLNSASLHILNELKCLSTANPQLLSVKLPEILQNLSNELKTLSKISIDQSKCEDLMRITLANTAATKILNNERLKSIYVQNRVSLTKLQGKNSGAKGSTSQPFMVFDNETSLNSTVHYQLASWSYDLSMMALNQCVHFRCFDDSLDSSNWSSASEADKDIESTIKNYTKNVTSMFRQNEEKSTKMSIDAAIKIFSTELDMNLCLINSLSQLDRKHIVENWRIHFNLYLQSISSTMKHTLKYLQGVACMKLLSEKNEIPFSTLLYLHFLILHKEIDLIESSLYLPSIPTLAWKEYAHIIIGFIKQADPDSYAYSVSMSIMQKLIEKNPESVIIPIVRLFSAEAQSLQNKESCPIMSIVSKECPTLLQETLLFVRQITSICILPDDLVGNFVHDINSNISRILNSLDVFKKEKYQQLNVQIEKQKYLFFQLLLNQVQKSVKKLFNCVQQRSTTSSYADEFYSHCREYFENLLELMHKIANKPKELTENWNLVRDLQNQIRNLSNSVQAFYRLNPKTLSLNKVVPPSSSHNFVELSLPSKLKGESGMLPIFAIHGNISRLSTKTKPKKIQILLRDGSTWNYLVKGFENLTNDFHVMCLMSISKQILNSQYSRKPFGNLYEIIPLSSTVGLVEWVENCETLYFHYTEYLRKFKNIECQNSKVSFTQSETQVSINPKSVFTSKVVEKMREIKISEETIQTRRNEWPLGVLSDVFDDVSSKTPNDLFLRQIVFSSSNCQQFVNSHLKFLHSSTFHSIFGHFVGLGDRHLNNLLLNSSTGELTHVDFNICFDKGKFLGVPELVPFRMTQNIERCLGPLGAHGSFLSLAQEISGEISKNSHFLLMYLELLTFDPDFHDSSCSGISSYHELIHEYYIKFCRTGNEIADQDESEKCLTETHNIDVLREFITLDLLNLSESLLNGESNLSVASSTDDAMMRTKNLLRSLDDVTKQAKEIAKIVQNRLTETIQILPPLCKEFKKKYDLKYTCLSQFMECLFLYPCVGMIPICNSILQKVETPQSLSSIISENDFKNLEEWIKMQSELNKNDISWIETRQKQSEAFLFECQQGEQTLNTKISSIQNDKSGALKKIHELTGKVGSSLSLLCSFGKTILFFHKHVKAIFMKENLQNASHFGVFSVKEYFNLYQIISTLINVSMIAETFLISVPNRIDENLSKFFADFNRFTVELDHTFLGLHQGESLDFSRNTSNLLQNLCSFSEFSRLQISQLTKRSRNALAEFSPRIIDGTSFVEIDQNNVEYFNKNFNSSNAYGVYNELARLYLKVRSKLIMNEKVATDGNSLGGLHKILQNVDAIHQNLFGLVEKSLANKPKFILISHQIIILCHKLMLVHVLLENICRCFPSIQSATDQNSQQTSERGIFFRKLSVTAIISDTISLSFSSYVYLVMRMYSEKFFIFTFEACEKQLCTKIGEFSYKMPESIQKNHKSNERLKEMIDWTIYKISADSSMNFSLTDFNKLVEKFANCNRRIIAANAKRSLSIATKCEIERYNSLKISLKVLDLCYSLDDFHERSDGELGEKLEPILSSKSCKNIVYHFKTLRTLPTWKDLQEKQMEHQRLCSELGEISKRSSPDYLSNIMRELMKNSQRLNYIKDLVVSNQSYSDDFVDESRIDSKIVSQIDSFSTLAEEILKKSIKNVSVKDWDTLKSAIRGAINSTEYLRENILGTLNYQKVLNKFNGECFEISNNSFEVEIKSFLLLESKNSISNHLSYVEKVWKRIKRKFCAFRTKDRIGMNVSEENEKLLREITKRNVLLLISEAKNKRHLCRMYEGWTAWV